MGFNDEYRFSATAGKGGNGVVRWTREKFRPKGGPCGGNGGKGGDVIIESTRDIMVLGRISHIASYAAENGHDGEDASKTGANGKDHILRLPRGSVITNKETGSVIELNIDGERVKLLSGGKGGFGNEHFKSSTNQTPKQATHGVDGERGTFHVELKLFADIGLVGLPNAGKTSLLNTLTNAGAKVGDYPFTTLDPNLGVFHGFVIADIPGLIEGAAEGRGLGHKFLRHVSRTGLLLHCISCEADNLTSVYSTVRDELRANKEVADKNELVVITKTDLVDTKTLNMRKKKLVHDTGCKILGTVSVLDDVSVAALGVAISKEMHSISDKE